ncbi:DUF427 domain-containing protein [Minwuia sp.]|uniref:DUF427 domain-containing protein n=1 Tax=Minwuia sp. TaxID=2493630 RepID=UPI003A8E3AC2
MKGPLSRIAPGPGQESVWDYPRPPRLEPSTQTVEVWFGGRQIALTQQSFRILETSHPPTYYIPLGDIDETALRRAAGQSYCEFKGIAEYWSLETGGQVSEQAGWSYPAPTRAFAALKGSICFYPSRVARCLVDGEIVQAQEGDFYGGWITSKVVGPFKGIPGSRFW